MLFYTSALCFSDEYLLRNPLSKRTHSISPENTGVGKYEEAYSYLDNSNFFFSEGERIKPN